MANSQQNNVNMKVLLAWAFVGIPLLWGVLQTASNAMKLFH
jgi:hypothetical protein